VYILPEDGHRSGPKHVVVVHNKIEHEKHLLRTVVLIKVLEELYTSKCRSEYQTAQEEPHSSLKKMVLLSQSSEIK
jgi:hypothetical protein